MLCLRLVVVFCKRPQRSAEWKVWLVKRYPTVEMRSAGKPMLDSNESLLQYFSTFLQSSSNDEGEQFVVRGLSLHGEHVLIDELMRDLLVVLLQCKHFDEMEHKLRFIKQLNTIMPFGTPTTITTMLEFGKGNEYVSLSTKWKNKTSVVFREDTISLVTYKEETINWMMESSLLLCPHSSIKEEEVTIKFNSPVHGVLPAHECVLRFDSSHVTFRTPPQQQQSTICLAQWQVTTPDHLPLHVAYRLRKAELRGFHLIVKVSLDVAPSSFVKLDITLHLPARVLDVSKLKFNHHQQPVRFNGSNVFLSMKSPTSALLQGFVQCAEDAEDGLLFQGETSCAEIDFAWTQHETEHDSSSPSIKIAQRSIRSGKYIVWNPFGDLPLGSFAVLKHKT